MINNLVRPRYSYNDFRSVEQLKKNPANFHIVHMSLYEFVIEQDVLSGPEVNAVKSNFKLLIYDKKEH